ncbi:MAG: FKBP-type peptidyl-prolyl cis-trans isomerase [Bacteroidota bacterium]
MWKYLWYGFVFAIMLTACKEDELIFEECLIRDLAAIEAHVASNNLEAIFNSSDNIYQQIDTSSGMGALPNLDNLVEVRYAIYALDGTVFGATTGNRTIKFRISQEVEGLQSGLVQMRRGDKATFYVPSCLALGDEQVGEIPPHTILVFDIEMVDFDLPYEEQLDIDLSIIQNHLDSNNISATFEETRDFYYQITATGSGTSPVLDNIVTVKYKGYFLDGTVFDETTGDETARFALSGVIQGWQRAVPLLKPGGKGTFYLPSGLCYGFIGNNNIGANTILVFDIELISVE